MQVCANRLWVWAGRLRGCLPSQRAWLAVCHKRSGHVPAVANLYGCISSRASYKARAYYQIARRCLSGALLCAVLAATHRQRHCLLRALPH
jgi:hypothetical protein